MNVATISNLTVKYGNKVAVEDLTVEVPNGSVGLLGPNGAGKTTLIKTLLGFLQPAAGRGQVLGFDIARDGLRIRQTIGLLPETDSYIPGMNAVAFVAYAGELAGMPAKNALQRAHEVLEYVGLGEARYRNVETYSTGMKQRAKLAQALVHGPQLIFLDEPTNGLDPAGRDEMLKLIRDVSHGKGVNVLVSSHLLPDIERTCDSVIVLKQGHVVTQGSIAELRATSVDLYEVDLRVASEMFRMIIEGRGGQLLHQFGSHYRFKLPQGTENPGRFLFEAAKEAGAQVRSFRPAHRSLEDIFMEAIG